MDKKKAKCIICGKEIEINKHSSDKKCKCTECQNKYKNICINCGKVFIGNRHQKLCSQECVKEYRFIPTLIKYFNFDNSKWHTNQVHEEVNKIKNILYNLYWNEHKSSSEICKIYNYPNIGNLTAKLFTYLNIPSKTSKQATKENYLEGRIKVISCPNYKQQWHTTWNGKEVYLHSSYELDYAKELDEQQIDYEVEYFRIKYWDSQRKDYRCAIPDFYIHSTNTIIEIKSEYTLDKQNMKDKMKAYLDLGYNFKLICDHKEILI